MKEVLNYMDTSALTTAGLVLFVAVFAGVMWYAMTRSARQADQWSRIPLTSETPRPTNFQTDEDR